MDHNRNQQAQHQLPRHGDQYSQKVVAKSDPEIVGVRSRLKHSLKSPFKVIQAHERIFRTRHDAVIGECYVHVLDLREQHERDKQD